MTQKVGLTLLSSWLGAAAFFSFVLAPTAFAVLPAQHLAGQVVSRTLGVVEIAGIVVGAILLLLSFLSRGRRGKAFPFDLSALALILLAMIGSRIVSGRMHALRVQAGETLYSLTAIDPLRSAFDQLHRYSVGLMSVAMIVALVLIVRMLLGKSGLPANA
ncbi:MAG: DUF4149 domain-containing protein [Acidobacteriota bacterium]